MFRNSDISLAMFRNSDISLAMFRNSDISLAMFRNSDIDAKLRRSKGVELFQSIGVESARTADRAQKRLQLADPLLGDIAHPSRGGAG
jgi:uncharacterized protein YjbI with pentapeptide repeats